MTKEQFSRAYNIAVSKTDLSGVNDEPLYGCGLAEFEPVTTTVEAVAKLLRWQIVCLNGSIDTVELNNMSRIARREFMVV